MEIHMQREMGPEKVSKRTDGKEYLVCRCSTDSSPIAAYLFIFSLSYQASVSFHTHF